MNFVPLTEDALTTILACEPMFWQNVRMAIFHRTYQHRAIRASSRGGAGTPIELANVAVSMLRPRGDYCAIRLKGLALPEGVLKALSVTLCGRRLFVNLTYEVELEALPGSVAAVGIDMGVSDRLALSNGERVGRRRKPNKRLARMQRRLSGCKRGGHRWRKRKSVLANHQYRERVRNRNECHRVTTELVRRFGLIALEDLPVKNMTASAKGTLENPGRNVRQKAGLNRSITEQTRGLLRTQLAYKAEWAGRELVVVDPKFTSQRCSECGVVYAEHRQRKRYDCAECGMTEDADVNAARNILHKALAGRRESGYRLPAAS